MSRGNRRAAKSFAPCASCPADQRAILASPRDKTPRPRRISLAAPATRWQLSASKHRNRRGANGQRRKETPPRQLLVISCGGFVGEVVAARDRLPEDEISAGLDRDNGAVARQLPTRPAVGYMPHSRPCSRSTKSLRRSTARLVIAHWGG